MVGTDIQTAKADTDKIAKADDGQRQRVDALSITFEQRDEQTAEAED